MTLKAIIAVPLSLEEWPNCETPDCEYKVCLWARTNLCARCSQRVLGLDEFFRRFVIAHPERIE